MTRLVSLKGVNSTLMLRVPVTVRRNPIVKGLPPVILEKRIRIRNFILRSQFQRYLDRTKSIMQ